MNKLALLLATLFVINIVSALPNPAAVYCKSLGYNYNIVKTPQGEHGECVFSATEKCDDWAFLTGKCGKNYSYCVKNGYDIKTVSDGKNPYSPEYAVCVPKTPYQKEAPVTDFITLNSDMILPETTGTVNYTTASPMVLNASLPSYIDWRNLNGSNWTTPVKDQGDCGSCWAFATVGALEAKMKIENNNPSATPDFSEQDLVSCGIPVGFYHNGAGGCKGIKNETDPLNYVKNNGTVDEACFPYNATDLPCSNRCSNWASRLQKIAYWKESSDIRKDLLDGPIVTGMHWGGDWVNGVYLCNPPGPPDPPNHMILIVGYNDTGRYWIVKNSFGTNWLNGTTYYDYGYFKIYYGNCSVGYYYGAFEEYIFTPTTLTQSVAPASGAFAPVTATFSCNYSNSSGAPVTGATVLVFLNGTSHAATYNSAVSLYQYQVANLGAGTSTWYCSASKTGYQTQVGSALSYIVVPSGGGGGGSGCGYRKCLLVEPAAQIAVGDNWTIAIIILAILGLCVGYFILRAALSASATKKTKKK